MTENNNVSGGVNAKAEVIDIGGDAVGRDKIVQQVVEAPSRRGCYIEIAKLAKIALVFLVPIAVITMLVMSSATFNAMLAPDKTATSISLLPVSTLNVIFPSPSPTIIHPTSTLRPTSTKSPTRTTTGEPPNQRTPTLVASQPPILGYHVVRSGETLFCIGHAYGVSPSAIAKENRISDPNLLRVGDKLAIPDVPWVNMPSESKTCSRQFSLDTPTPSR